MSALSSPTPSLRTLMTAPPRALLLLLASATLAACNCGTPDKGGDGLVATRLAFVVQPPDGSAGAPLAPALQVALQTDEGETVAVSGGSVSLALEANPGAATLGGTLSAPLVDGVATFSAVSLDRAGAGYTLRAESGGLTAAVSEAFDITAGPPAALVFAVQPSESEAGGVISPPVQVRIEDAFGNPALQAAPEISVALADNPGGGALLGTTTVTAVNGVATFSELSLAVAAEGYTLAATGAGLPEAKSQPFTVRPGQPAQLAFSAQPTDVTAGAAISPAVTVEIRDTRGNRVRSANDTVVLTFAANPGNGTLSGTTAAAAVNGVATFSDLSITAAAAGYSLSASSGTLSAATSDTFAVGAASPAAIAFRVEPANTPAGAVLTPAVEVTFFDAYGNLTPSSDPVTLSVASAPPGAVMSGTATRSAVGGVATFSDLRFDLAGDYALDATAAVGTARSAPFTIGSGQPANLAFTVQPQSTTAGSALSPSVSVSVLDTLGNLATGFEGDLTVALAPNAFGGVLSGTVTVTASAGVATFSGLSVAQAGVGYQLVASASGLSSATSSAFDIAAGAATRLAFAQQPSETEAGVAIDPAVRVHLLDAWGNLTGSTQSVSLGLGANPAGGTLLGGDAVAASSGVATFAALSLQKAGSGYTLTAQASGLDPATSQPFTVRPGAATSLVFNPQPSNTTVSQAMAAFSVTARDAYGNDAPSAAFEVSLTLATNPSGATLSGTTTRALSGGVATFDDLVLDAVGSGYTLSASGNTLQVTSAAFDVIAGTPAALAFHVQPSNGVSGQPLAPAVEVEVVDAAGNRATSFSGDITVALSGPSTTLGGTTTVTAAAGLASFTDLAIAQAGSGYRLSASSAGLGTVGSALFDIAAGEASSVVFTVHPSHTTAGQSIAPAVRVELRDAAGNLASSATGDITVALSSGGALGGTTTRQVSGGAAEFGDLYVDAAGTGYRLRATYGALAQVLSNPFDISAGAASSLVFSVQPSNTTAGAVISPAVAVTARDAVGNTVTGFTDPVTLSLSGAGTLQGTLTASAVSGVATFADLSIPEAGADYTLIASSGTLPTASSTAFDVTVGAATRLAFVQGPTSTTAGAAISPALTVVAQDAAGNTVSSASGSVTLALGATPTGGVLSGTATRPLVGGVATFDDLSVAQAGSGYTLIASSGALTSATSGAFDITAGPAAVLAFTGQPASTSAGASLGAVTVEVRDAFGNKVSTSSTQVSLSLSSGALSGTTTQLTSAGVASFLNLSVQTAGTDYTLAADASGFGTATSAPFSISAAAPTQMEFAVQPPSSVAAGAGFAVEVRFKDAFGNPTSNATAVTLSLAADPTGSATLGGTTLVTSANGVASFSGLWIDKAATGYTLRAASAVAPSITSSAVDVTAGPAAALVFTQQPTSTTAGETISPAVTVTIRDAFGNTVTGSTATVVLSLQNNPGDGFLGGTTSVTASAGVASFSTLVVHSAAAGYTLRADSSGLPVTDSAAFNISAGPATSLRFGQQPTHAAVGAAIQPAVTVVLEDAYGNIATGSSLSVSMALGTNPSGATLGGTTSRTAISGVATFSDLTVSAAGTGYTLRASASGLDVVNSAWFNVTAAPVSGLVYTDPTGGKLLLLRNPASTTTTVVLDLIAAEELVGYSVGFNLPLDTSRVSANATLLQPGTALHPGSAPAAAIASLPSAGPLANVLVSGQSQKAAGTGAITTDTVVPAGSVLYTLRLDARAGATPGVVFDGAALGAQFRGLFRDKAGNDVVTAGDFGIGRLDLL